MWLTGRLAPDFKTIADFRKDNGEAIRLVCREFVMLCRKLNLLRETPRGDRWQQVQGGQQPRQELHPGQDEAAACSEVDASIERYLSSWPRPIGRNPREDKRSSLKDKIAALKEEMAAPKKARGPDARGTGANKSH